MFSSKNKMIFDLWLEKLNENTQGVTFDGNFMFQFNQAGTNNFNIISLDELDFKETKVVPVVDVQSIQIPFVENNDRDDWEREFYLAIEIPASTDSVTGNMIIEFEESNEQFQAVLETLDTLKSNLTFTDDNYKYSFKVKEPTKVGVFTYNGVYYQILSVTFNLSTIKEGFFGNETKLYFGLKSDTSFGQTDEYELDTMEYSEITGKTKRANSNINDTEETYSISKRTWTPTLTINFNGNTADLLLYKELTAQADLQVEYQLTVTNSALNTASGEDLDYTYDVIVTSINSTRKNNVVDTITFQLDRV